MKFKAALLVCTLILSFAAQATDYLSCNFEVFGTNQEGGWVRVAYFADYAEVLESELDGIQLKKAQLAIGEDGMKVLADLAGPGSFSLVFAPATQFGSVMSIVLNPRAIWGESFAFGGLLHGTFNEIELKHMVGSCIITNHHY